MGRADAGGGHRCGWGGRGLTLYHITDEPPALVVTNAQPQHQVEEQLGRLLLVGYDLEADQVEAGGALHLTLYWRLEGPPRGLLIGTVLGGKVLETHEPGLENLQRYVETFHPPRDGILVEDYQVVIPRLTEPGIVPLKVLAVVPFGEEGPQVVGRVTLQEVTILPGEGR